VCQTQCFKQTLTANLAALSRTNPSTRHVEVQNLIEIVCESRIECVSAKEHCPICQDMPMDAAAYYVPLDLSHAPLDVITTIMESMPLRDRFTCGLVCKAWAEAATAATRRIVTHRVQDFSCLQTWLCNQGKHVEELQLHESGDVILSALPCAQLEKLLLEGRFATSSVYLDTRVWSDIAAATKLTSLTLSFVNTNAQPADVVSALTALPDLEQLTWDSINYFSVLQRGLADSMLFQKLTKLTALRLDYVAEAEVLVYLSLLTRLQDLSIGAAEDCTAAGCPGLQELKALTRLELLHTFNDIPASISQLTALQQLDVPCATPTAFNKLHALTGLTQLRLSVNSLSADSAPLQLPGLQHLEAVAWNNNSTMPASFMASCTQLRVLQLSSISISPGILAATTMLQHLELEHCSVDDAEANAAEPASWQQVFPGPGRLPHLTLLKLKFPEPDLYQDDIKYLVACCSSLQVLQLDSLPGTSASALTCLSGLTSLTLWLAKDKHCSSLAQVTGLRELKVTDPRQLSVAGLVQLAALAALTCLGFKINPSYGWYPDKVNPLLWTQVSDKLSDCTHGIINKVCVEGGHGFGCKPQHGLCP